MEGDDRKLTLNDNASLKEAIRQTIGRKGSFSSLDPLSSLSGKIEFDKNGVLINKLNDTELRLLLETVEENILYITNYQYPEVDGSSEFGKKRKAELISPLRVIHGKLLNMINEEN